MSDRYITLVVHGESKVGKTWLGATTPPPRLILDVEAGGMRFVPGATVKWNPLADPPPDADGTWETCQATITDIRALDMVFQWLNSGQHPFRSVTVDSLMEVQSRMKRELADGGVMSEREWGILLTHLEDLVVKIRDLSEHPTRPIDAVVFITGTRMKDGRFRPLLQGQIANLLPYKVDAIGFMFTTLDESGNVRRGLMLDDDGTHVAGNRLGGRVPAVVWEPSVTGLLDQIFGPETTTTEGDAQHG